MHDFCKHVNAFQGSGTTCLPTPQRIAAAWFFIKAIAGNTHPGATLPFGKYSCCAYTGGFSSGYGENYKNNSPWNIRQFKNGAKFLGLSHFHQSGTGSIDYYYNFAVTTPFFGNSRDLRDYDILSEDARPGYYTIVSEGGIRSETTVSAKKVYHRFCFGREGGRIAIDFTNSGLLKIGSNYYSRPNEGRITIVSPREARAEVVIDGLKHYFLYRADNAKALSLLRNNTPIEGKSVSFGQSEDTYGVLFDAEGVVASACFSASLLSMDDAAADMDADEGGFDAAAKKSYEIWNDHLGRIEIEGASQTDLEIFYSNLYHSLVKPSDRSGESPVWSESDFVVDLCTLWDVYRTQFPLLFTLYPEISSKIVNTIFLCGRHLGLFPHKFLLKSGFIDPSRQACMIADQIVCDAFIRGVPADYAANLQTVLNDIFREDYKPLLSFDTLPSRATFVIDASEACAAVAPMADALGNPDAAEELRKIAARWTEAYDPQTGLMQAGCDYYEGTHWNHSFRLLHDMKKRIELAGGRDAFVALLDRFFGFTNQRSTDTRFEGFNNETDMETPYNYNYVGRRDRLCEIIDAANKFMFGTGRGGLPGNNDSGGISSCYVWNAVGVFPVTGQDLMIVGTPRFPKTVFHLPGGRYFTVERKGKGIYVRSASLDGQPLADFTFKASRMMEGGRLICEMTDTPC